MLLSGARGRVMKDPIQMCNLVDSYKYTYYRTLG